MTTDKTPATLASADASYTTGHCAHNNRPGGCHLHNLQCGWPACDRRPAKPSLATVKHGGCVQLGQDQRSDLVPGVVRCAKCAFQLHRTNLYLQSGTVGAGDSKTEPCPNGCGPLWPVTWETWAREGWAEAERLHLEMAALSAQPSPSGKGDAGPLSVYADSYRRMAKMGDGRVSCIDVAFDIEHNMSRALAARQPVCGTCNEAIQPDAMTGTKCACSRVPVASIQPSGNSGELAVDTQPVGPEEVWVTIVDGEAVDASNTKCSMTGLPDGYGVVRFVSADLAARQPVRIYGCCAQPEGELHTAECPNMRHLGARQPVGEPVAVEIPQGAIINGAAFADRLEQDYQFECPAGPLVNCTDYVEFRRCFDYLAQWASSLPPLYAAPTAQTVDLGQFREAVAYAARSADFATHAEIGDKLRELLALIDSEVVGK